MRLVGLGDAGGELVLSTVGSRVVILGCNRFALGVKTFQLANDGTVEGRRPYFRLPLPELLLGMENGKLLYVRGPA